MLKRAKGGGHPYLTKGGHRVTISGTPGDLRSDLNARAFVRRCERGVCKCRGATVLNPEDNPNPTITNTEGAPEPGKLFTIDGVDYYVVEVADPHALMQPLDGGSEFYFNFRTRQVEARIRMAADFGVGPNNPGVKDWMNREWAGTDQFDQMPPPGWDDAPDESDPQSGIYECADCGRHFRDYDEWREHVVAEHVRGELVQSPPEPWVDMDATFPDHFVEYQRKQDQLGVTAGWTLASDDVTDSILDFFDVMPNREPRPEPTPEELAQQQADRDRRYRERIEGWGKTEDGLLKYAEQVPIGEVMQLREYDREPGGEHSFRPREEWEHLKGTIAEYGIASPLFLSYHPDTHTASLTEGNHRLKAALELGMTHVPVLGHRSDYPQKHRVNHKQGAPTDVDSMGEPRWPEYIRPSDIGLPVREVNDAGAT